MFAVHGTIIRLHVQQTKLDYLARKFNIPVNIPSTDTSIFLSFLPFPYFFLLFTLCPSCTYSFLSVLFLRYCFFFMYLFQIFLYVLICSLRYLSQTLYAYPVPIMPHQVEYRLWQAHPIFSFHFNSHFTISSYNTLGSKLVHKQRQCLVLSQDQISLHCNNTDIHLTFEGNRKGPFRVPSCLFLHRNAVRPYLQQPGIDWRTPHNYSAPFSTARVRRWSVPTCKLD